MWTDSRSFNPFIIGYGDILQSLILSIIRNSTNYKLTGHEYFYTITFYFVWCTLHRELHNDINQWAIIINQLQHPIFYRAGTSRVKLNKQPSGLLAILAQVGLAYYNGNCSRRYILQYLWKQYFSIQYCSPASQWDVCPLHHHHHHHHQYDLIVLMPCGRVTESVSQSNFSTR